MAPDGLSFLFRLQNKKDKPKVEKAVQVVENWVLGPLRHWVFFSLNEVNQELRRYLEDLNNRPFQKLEGTRRTAFEALDKPALKPLPAQRYQFGLWKKAKINIDYHVEVDKCYYSTPHKLIGQQVDIRITANTVEVIFKGARVAVHPRQLKIGSFSTEPKHMPASHKAYLEWTPERVISWAKSTGPYTNQAVEKILNSYRHPQQGFRSCMGIIRLAKQYGNDRLEMACLKMVAIGTPSYQSIKSILENGLDRLVIEEATPAAPPIKHNNLRGPGYFNPKGGTLLC